MHIKHISEMWHLLMSSPMTPRSGKTVNHLNEWGGFSRALGMPVFTAWLDHTRFDREIKLDECHRFRFSVGRSG